MSKTGKIVLFSFLLIASIVFLVFMFISRYNIYLNEYNAQIQQLGYYKEDIHLLNQSVQSGFITAGIVFSVFSIIIWGCSLFFAALE